MHIYKEIFFDYIESGSLASAEVIVPIVVKTLKPKSLLDVGCGRGAWCSKWIEHGVSETYGIDGDYVSKENLLFPQKKFIDQDLAKLFSLNRKFDLVVSLEVAEHIPKTSADIFVQNLVKHGDLVLFSAATPGQGGEFHVNEQPLEYWREKFAAAEYLPIDFLRKKIIDNEKVMPWYKYNTVLYAHKTVFEKTSELCNQKHISQTAKLADVSPFFWKFRCFMLSKLPNAAVNMLSSYYHDFQIWKNNR